MTEKQNKKQDSLPSQHKHQPENLNVNAIVEDLDRKIRDVFSLKIHETDTPIIRRIKTFGLLKKDIRDTILPLQACISRECKEHEDKHKEHTKQMFNNFLEQKERKFSDDTLDLSDIRKKVIEKKTDMNKKISELRKQDKNKTQCIIDHCYDRMNQWINRTIEKLRVYYMNNEKIMSENEIQNLGRAMFHFQKWVENEKEINDAMNQINKVSKEIPKKEDTLSIKKRIRDKKEEKAEKEEAQNEKSKRNENNKNDKNDKKSNSNDSNDSKELSSRDKVYFMTREIKSLEREIKTMKDDVEQIREKRKELLFEQVHNYNMGITFIEASYPQ